MSLIDACIFFTISFITHSDFDGTFSIIVAGATDLPESSNIRYLSESIAAKQYAEELFTEITLIFFGISTRREHLCIETKCVFNGTEGLTSTE